jgi:hypothetical protein
MNKMKVHNLSTLFDFGFEDSMREGITDVQRAETVQSRTR